MPEMTVKKKAKKRGPKADVLKLKGSWKSNIKLAFQKERPKDGWPKPD
jgi:hypothetical protein